MAKNAYIGASGVARKVKQPYIGVSSVARKVKNGYIGVSGVARQFWKSGLALGDIAVGSTVYLNESGSPVEFYVAKHDYESELNGTGRTLLVRKYIYDKREWYDGDTNKYGTSYIDTWLNDTYKTLLDEEIQAAINTTKFYYSTGSWNKSVEVLERAVFLLSCTELGKSGDYVNTEGTALPIASTLTVAYSGSSAPEGTTQWTRSPYTANLVHAWYVNKSGTIAGAYTSVTRGSRPVFTLPSTSLFNPDTMEFVST